jgi:hypothetical protein
MFSFLTQLFEENHWLSITGLIDSSSLAREYSARGMNLNFQTNFNREEVDSKKNVRYNALTYESSKGYAEVERILQQMSKVSRSEENLKNKRN